MSQRQKQQQRQPSSERLSKKQKRSEAARPRTVDVGLSVADLPVECRLEIIGFLDQSGLHAISLVSKQFNEDIWREGNQNKMICVYEITPNTFAYRDRCGNDIYSTAAFLRRLCHNRLNENARFSRYEKIKVHRIGQLNKISEKRVKAITFRNNNIIVIRFDRVSSLDFSEPGEVLGCVSNKSSQTIVKFLLSCLPNLKEIDFSRFWIGLADLDPGGNNRGLFFQCVPLLEKITWKQSLCLCLEGRDFKNCTNVTEMFLDDSEFFIGDAWTLSNEELTELDNKLSDLGSHPNDYIFSHIHSLTRLSIRNAKYKKCGRGHGRSEKLLQNMMIKFVRNAPSSLRWFRSDLTRENIRMLRVERPGVELLN